MKNKVDIFFTPNIIGLILNPFYITRINLYKHIKNNAAKLKGKLLDIGCGDKPYENLFTNVEQYDGLEIENSVHTSTKADFLYDGNKMPFEDNSYDSIVLNEVIEHVFNVDELLAEIRRVLKQNGKILITLPFCWDEHEQPYDFARYSSFGITHILEKNNLEIESLTKSCPNIGVLFQLLNGYIYKVTYKLPKFLRAMIVAIFCFPITVFGIIFGYILPNNHDLYLDNIIVAINKK